MTRKVVVVDGGEAVEAADAELAEAAVEDVEAAE